MFEHEYVYRYMAGYEYTHVDEYANIDYRYKRIWKIRQMIAVAKPHHWKYFFKELLLPSAKIFI